MELLKFFFQPTCCKKNDYSKLENDEDEIHTKFLLNYFTSELQQLNSLIDPTEYDAVWDKFEKLLMQYKSANKINESISLVKRSVISEADDKKKAFKKKLKKRSAYNANITVINEEEEMDSAEPKEANKDTARRSDDHFFFKSDEIVTGNLKALKKPKLLKQASFDVSDLSALNKTPGRPKKKHRASKSVEETEEQEKTHYMDAQSTMHTSKLKSSKKKSKSVSKKTKKKLHVGDLVEEENCARLLKVTSTSMFLPKEEDLRPDMSKFVKGDSEVPFDLKKTKKVNLNITVHADLVKSKPRVSLSAAERKLGHGKISKLKNLFENMAKKTKEKIKVELDGKKKIPRVSDPKSIDKRKSRLSAGKQTAKRKSEKGIKTFIAESLGIKKEKLEKLNEIKNNLIQKQQAPSKTPHINMTSIKKLDLLASKCVTLKKISSNVVPKGLNTTVGASKPSKNFIEINKQKMKDTANKKAGLDTTVGSLTNKSLFYPTHNESSSHVYKALNDFAVEQLKNQKLAKENMAKQNELRKGLDTMVMLKKPVQRNLPRYGSTSTISTQSSLDSNTSILSNTSSINDSAFKSASSKFTSMNSTMSSIMTNDKTYVSTNQSKTNNSLLKGYIAKQNVFKKQPNVIVTVTSSKTPKKNTFLIPAQKQLLQIPELKPKSSKNPAVKLTKHVDYNINDLNSEDETDDEEEPNKPIPAWAEWKLVTERVLIQNRATINFTKLFSAAADDNIDLSNIFAIQRNRFKARTSSAHWPQPAVWKSEGITGDESFRNQ